VKEGKELRENKGMGKGANEEGRKDEADERKRYF
jgi:hypothetical protein